ncbi:hypothetical protein LCGC14_1204420 [marine sediment metagenome]|uniref:Uncharacterized protein n=1 Tax=marine sediment metagenome TaxID=412755 RepID=A0A0F9LFZ2_9ZZZZ
MDEKIKGDLMIGDHVLREDVSVEEYLEVFIVEEEEDD